MTFWDNIRIILDGYGMKSIWKNIHPGRSRFVLEECPNNKRHWVKPVFDLFDTIENHVKEITGFESSYFDKSKLTILCNTGMTQEQTIHRDEAVVALFEET